MAFATAFATAAAVGMIGGSPSPFAPRLLALRSGRSVKRTTISGYPTLQENAVEQDAQNTYRYAAWFIFGRKHVLLVSCQVDRRVNKVARACGSLLESMKLS